MTVHPDPVSLVRSTLFRLACDATTTAEVGATRMHPFVLDPAALPADDEVGPAILHITDALSQGVVVVEELVPAVVSLLRFHNKGAIPVFVPAGTVVRGGGQNRIVAVSTLLLAGDDRQVEVRCVEAQRWNPRENMEFSEASSAPLSLKSRKFQRDTSARMRGGQRAEDQGETWTDVRTHLSSMHVASRTQSLFDAIDHAAPQVAPIPESIASAPGVWFEGATTAGEVFPVPSLRRSGVKGLTESARLDGRAGAPSRRVAFDDVRTDVLERGRFTETQVSGGVIVDFEGPSTGVVGSAFVAEGRVLHISITAA